MSIPLALSYLGLKRQLYKASMPTTTVRAVRSIVQGRHGEFELGKAQYSTPNFFDRLFLIRRY